MSSQDEPVQLESVAHGAPEWPGGSSLDRALAAEQQRRFLERGLRESSVGDQAAPVPPIRPPTVVVEIAGAEMGAAVVDVLRSEGYQAVVCGGPAALLTGQCPLVEGRSCPLVEWADVVVHALGIEDPEGRAVFEAERRASLDRPNVVVTGLGGRPADRLRGRRGRTIVVDGPLTRRSLLGAVESALQAQPPGVTVLNPGGVSDEP